MTTQAEIESQNRRAARRFFWTLLILATATSVYGNIAHAVGASDSVQLNSIIGACIAPIFLMALVHGLAHLARSTASGLAYWLVVALVGGVAAFAFAQSYGALTAFARDAKVLAPGLTPLIVDATIGVSTFALVVLGVKPMKRGRTPRGATSDATKLQADAAARPAARASNPKVNRATATTSGDLSRASTRTRSATQSATLCETARSQRAQESGGMTLDLAADLVRDKITRLDVEVVRAILEAHHDGDPLNRIAKDVRCHHTAVKRIIDAAEARQDRLAAAG